MRRWPPVLLLLACGCASSETPSGPADPPPQPSGNDDASIQGGGFPLGTPPPSGDDVATTWPADSVDATSDAPGEDAVASTDGSWEAPPSFPPFDPGEGGVCTGALAAGDVVIDELMIESVAGAGDHGEWLEARSTVSCALNIRGLRGNAPSGGKVRSFQVGGDLWIPALGTFVVADSSNKAINHDLPGTVLVWSGQPGDVLRNKGGTITLEMDGVMIDSVTYPSMMLTVGASLSFPSDCAPSRRSDWMLWQTSAASWFPGFYGTPNAPNDDVKCF
jgi:hypothetical protein